MSEKLIDFLVHFCGGKKLACFIQASPSMLLATIAVVFFDPLVKSKRLRECQSSRTGTGEAVVSKPLDDTQARIQKSYQLAAEARRVAEETRRLVDEAQRSLPRPRRLSPIAPPSNNGRPTV